MRTPKPDSELEAWAKQEAFSLAKRLIPKHLYATFGPEDGQAVAWAAMLRAAETRPDKSWMASCGRNIIIDEVRRLSFSPDRRRQPLAIGEHAETLADPRNGPADSLKGLMLDEMLGTLSADDEWLVRRVIMADDVSQQEAEERLGIGGRAIRKRKTRILAQLKRFLETK